MAERRVSSRRSVLYLAGYKSQELVSLDEYFGLDTQG